ncbi:hypothetical protein LCGC14_0548880 [marine sediment metagenome]|uniref:Uncharacterized protein n=1 Tax=marine sediment metagenome TaxID=412755 RepID=A0A0F9UYX9_9ZZZZ
MLDRIDYISKNEAISLVQKYHYSKVMPRITKYCIGGFKNNELVAICTLGYGVRPLHTIRKCFPDLTSKDYLEIGKLCVTDAMPKNTESYFIARIVKLIKQTLPEIKLLYSWSDGIIGKPGYVYQASNFYYGGFIWTEMYIDSKGNRVHPRTLQGISDGEKSNGNKFKSRSYEVTTQMGYTKYFGLQFRYLYPLCHKQEWRKLQETSPFEWNRNSYPKDKDCLWKKQVAKGEHESCGLPPFKHTNYVKDTNKQLQLFN